MPRFNIPAFWRQSQADRRGVLLQVTDSGRIRLSVSTASRTYELLEETYVTPFRTYIFRSTGLCNYKP